MVKIYSSCTQKVRFWYLLEIPFKIYDDHPHHFYMGVPPLPGSISFNRSTALIPVHESCTLWYTWFVWQLFCSVFEFYCFCPNSLPCSVLQFPFSSIIYKIKLGTIARLLSLNTCASHHYNERDNFLILHEASAECSMKKIELIIKLTSTCIYQL